MRRERLPYSPADFAQDVKAAARTCDAIIVSSIPGGSRQALTSALEPDEILALIKHLSPRVVYLNEVLYEGSTHIASLIGDDDELAVCPSVRALAKQWKSKEGQLCQVAVSVVYDGVQHTVLVEIPWLSQIEEAADQIASEIPQPTKNDYAERAAEDRKIVREKSKILLADKRFHAPKATKAKREYLAEVLFPDLENRLYGLIVQEAESAQWLQQIG